MKIIGRIDKIDIPDFNLKDIPAKIDTGANRSAIHCSKIELHSRDGIDEITFRIPLHENQSNNVFRSRNFFKKKIRSSSGHVEDRYIIRTSVVLFGEKIRTSFSLADRKEMRYPILLGRKLLKTKFIVDVTQENLSFSLKNKQS